MNVIVEALPIICLALLVGSAAVQAYPHTEQVAV
jgi:hypothetical protein